MAETERAKAVGRKIMSVISDNKLARGVCSNCDTGSTQVIWDKDIFVTLGDVAIKAVKAKKAKKVVEPPKAEEPAEPKPPEKVKPPKQPKNPKNK